MARPDSARLLLLGSGKVARALGRSLTARFRCARSPFGRRRGQSGAAAAALAAEGLPARAAASPDPGGFDIVSAATLSTAPLLRGAGGGGGAACGSGRRLRAGDARRTTPPCWPARRWWWDTAAGRLRRGRGHRAGDRRGAFREAMSRTIWRSCAGATIPAGAARRRSPCSSPWDGPERTWRGRVANVGTAAAGRKRRVRGGGVRPRRAGRARKARAAYAGRPAQSDEVPSSRGTPRPTDRPTVRRRCTRASAPDTAVRTPPGGNSMFAGRSTTAPSPAEHRRQGEGLVAGAPLRTARNPGNPVSRDQAGNPAEAGFVNPPFSAWPYSTPIRHELRVGRDGRLRRAGRPQRPRNPRRRVRPDGQAGRRVRSG